MNILVDGQTLSTPEIYRGIGIYFKNVLTNMVKSDLIHSWYISVDKKSSLSALPEYVQSRLIPVESKLFNPTSDYSKCASYSRMLESVIIEKKIDVYWNPNPLMVNVLFPDRKLSCQMVLTVHDLIPLVMPIDEWSNKVKTEYKRRLTFLKEESVRLLFVSKASRNDFNKYICEKQNEYVIPEAADEKLFYRKRVDLKRRKCVQIVFTGGFDYRKNMFGALKAFALSKKLYKDNVSVKDAILTIVCSAGDEQKESFMKSAEELGVDKQVKLTGYISNKELSDLYNTADVFFFPSLYEGFGLPLLEAMLGGAYILSADNSSLPEVVGEYGLFCKADDINDMANQLAKAITNSLEENISEKIKRQDYALTFSWKKTACETLAAFENDNGSINKKYQVAIVTPWPEMRTGIANYEYKLTPYLKKYMDVDIYVDQKLYDGKKARPVEGKVYSLNELKHNHNQYDAILYQCGNNADFHKSIYLELREIRGIAEIHDFNVHPFFYHAFYLNGEKASYKEALIEGYGIEGELLFNSIEEGTRECEENVYPMSHSIDAVSEATIVHNHWSKNRIENAFIIPHPCFECNNEFSVEINQQLKKRMHLEGQIVIGCFGFVNANKRPEVVLQAVASLVEEGLNVKLVFWGEDGSRNVERMIKEMNLEEVACISGYLEKNEYDAALEMTDIVINLRYPSMGESSGTLAEAFYCSKPVIVSDICAYSEFPNDVCWKVPIGESEISILTMMLKKLVSSREVRETLGENAGVYARQVLSPDKIAKEYFNAIDKIVKNRVSEECVKEDRPIAIIIPWFGKDIRGGAEHEARLLSQALLKAGKKVEVFTSCARDASCDRGKNTYTPGSYLEDGVVVRRFKVRENRDVDRYTESNSRIYNNDNYSLKDEEIYFKEDINSPELNKYIEAHADEYRVFIFIPYMYGITYNGIKVCPEKSIIIPCLHDESYAYMKSVKEMMQLTKGICFHSEQEKELAFGLMDIDPRRARKLGEVVEADWIKTCDANKFREKYGITEPFILYAGRKDSGKHVDELVDYFVRLKEEQDFNLKLILIGGGDLALPTDKRGCLDIIDLGFLPTEDKYNAYAACNLFCNPSEFESFSLVVMESWLAGKPVLVSGRCDVTVGFAKDANAGLWYNNYEEWKLCVLYLLTNPHVADAMGKNGRRYVLHNFDESVIAKRYLSFIEECGL